VPNRSPPQAGHAVPDRPSREVLVAELRGGGRDALDRAVTLLYAELREIAHRLRLGRRDAALDTLSLVHEAYLKLADNESAAWNDRAHFLALAAVVMRHVLTDDARARLASKREGDRPAVTLDEHALAAPEQPGALLDVADALERLERVDERLAQVVEYRFFGGLTNDEIGVVLGVDARTVRRDWARARTLLHSSLAP
jgi:RNA polymerase sigma factor (TIGR02999 family)